MAITGRLAASIAHEIRNPLDSATNLLYLLRSEPLETKRTEYIRRAEDALLRVSEIANNTLRFYHDPSGTTSFDIDELVQSIVMMFQGRISALQVKVETTLPRGIAVHMPQGELRQVIVNLIGNALDAMPHGGRLILRTRKFVNHHTGKPCVRLTVADTGYGMNPSVLARVFEAFYTTQRFIRQRDWIMAES